MTKLWIENVTLKDTAELAGYSLDVPTAGFEGRTYALPLKGWAVNAESPQNAVAAYLGETEVGRFPLNVRRPDIAQTYSHIPWAANCAFEFDLNTLRLPTEFSVELRIAFRDGDDTITIATVDGRRRELRPGARSVLQPLLLTTLGRTGSTWVAHSLSQHPSILACEPFRYEARAASYWVDILLALSDQASYMQMLRGELTGEPWWLGNGPQLPQESQWADDSVTAWLADEHVEALADFTFGEIGALYRSIADREPGTQPAFFVEKTWPRTTTADMILEGFEAGRELFLVRDFRDMLASILAYNRKTGHEWFGRALVSTDFEYVELLANDIEALLRRWNARKDESLLVRYEDFLLDPSRTLKQIFIHLEIDSSDAVIAMVRERASARAKDAQEEHRTSETHERSIGRWQRDLPRDLIQECDAAFGGYLEAFGYEPSQEGSHIAAAT